MALALGLVSTLSLRSATYTINSQTAFNTYKTFTFAPGDQILFQRGMTFTGQFAPGGSGTSSSRIVIDATGTGWSPIINGNGAVNGAIYLRNREYWTINNLEVTNIGSDPSCDGIYVRGSTGGTLTGIRISNCYVHNTGANGISVATEWADANTRFDLVEILNNSVKWTAARGIEVHNYHYVLSTTTPDKTKYSTNVYIRGNYLEGTDLNGIVVWGAAAQTVIEGNTLNACSDVDYGQGMFISYSDDAVIQDNEVYGTHYNGTEVDAGGIGIDYHTLRAVVQYNYVHDNDLSGIAVMANYADAQHYVKDCIIRYNISEHNGINTAYYLNAEFRVTGPVENLQVYNNVFVTKSGTPARMITTTSWGGYPISVFYKNNVFYHQASGIYYFDPATPTAQTFDYNVFYPNHPASEPADAHKLTSDPLFVNPNSGGTGLNTVDGYKLRAGSPALNSGTTISGNGGFDYWSSTLYNGSPERGAYEGAGVP